MRPALPHRTMDVDSNCSSNHISARRSRWLRRSRQTAARLRTQCRARHSRHGEGSVSFAVTAALARGFSRSSSTSAGRHGASGGRCLRMLEPDVETITWPQAIDQRLDVRSAMRRLKRDDRVVLAMRFLMDMSVDETAATSGDLGLGGESANGPRSRQVSRADESNRGDGVDGRRRHPATASRNLRGGRPRAGREPRSPGASSARPALTPRHVASRGGRGTGRRRAGRRRRAPSRGCGDRWRRAGHVDPGSAHVRRQQRVGVARRG